jgi:hypothetical protein
MTADPRAALTALVAAFERHLEVATARHDPDDQAVVTAAEELSDAFFDYDEALFDATGVTTPLDGPFDEDDLDDEDEDDDDELDDDVEDLEDDDEEDDDEDLDDEDLEEDDLVEDDLDEDDELEDDLDDLDAEDLDADDLDEDDEDDDLDEDDLDWSPAGDGEDDLAGDVIEGEIVQAGADAERGRPAGGTTR